MNECQYCQIDLANATKHNLLKRFVSVKYPNLSSPLTSGHRKSTNFCDNYLSW